MTPLFLDAFSQKAGSSKMIDVQLLLSYLPIFRTRRGLARLLSVHRKQTRKRARRTLRTMRRRFARHLERVRERAKPRDDLARLIRKGVIDNALAASELRRLIAAMATRELAEGNPESVLAWLSSIDTNRLRQLSEFCEFLRSDQSFEIDLRKVEGSTKSPCVIHFPVWGEAYLQTFFSYTLASLLAPKNLPRCSQERAIVIVVHTDQESWEKIADPNVVAALEQYCQLIVSYFPLVSWSSRNDLESNEYKSLVTNWRYFQFGSLQYTALQLAARIGASFSPIPADVCLSDGALSTWLDYEADGVDLVTTQAPRSDKAGALADIETHRQGISVDVPPSALLQLQRRHLHESNVERSLFSGNEAFGALGHLLFPYPDGFVMRGYHYHPILCGPRVASRLAEVGTTFVPIDDYAIQTVLKSGDEFRVYLPEQGQENGLLELSSAIVPRHKPFVEQVPGQEPEELDLSATAMARHFIEGVCRNLSRPELAVLTNRVAFGDCGAELSADEQCFEDVLRERLAVLSQEEPSPKTRVDQ